MTETTPASDAQTIAPGRPGSAFYVARAADKPIVDVLIEERCPKTAAHWTWPAVRPLLYAALGYRKARAMADMIAPLSGLQAFDRLSRQLNIDARVTGAQRIPREGRCVIVSNHPTGLADGIAAFDVLRDIRPDMVFFANADALRVNPRFDDLIIPIEWVPEKRSPAKTKETLRLAGAAFAAERCVVIFPSGRLAHKVRGRLVDKDWFPTAVSLARKQNAPIVPMHIRASNSALYYALCRASNELRDITLFHELLNKAGAAFEVTLGQPIAPEALKGDPGAMTRALKGYVEHVLPNAPDAPFQPA